MPALHDRERSGLVAALAARPGATAADLADAVDFDDFYVSVWCRSALAAGVVERAGQSYRLAPHLDVLLLDTASPAYVGGLFTVMQDGTCSTASRRASPQGSGCGGTSAARSGSPAWPPLLVEGRQGSGSPHRVALERVLEAYRRPSSAGFGATYRYHADCVDPAFAARRQPDMSDSSSSAGDE